MEILYKCRCMSKEVTLTVPDRQPAGDLLQWMEAVTVCIGMDHRARNALCLATEMEYMKIPFDDGSPGVGVKPVRQ